MNVLQSKHLRRIFVSPVRDASRRESQDSLLVLPWAMARGLVILGAVGFGEGLVYCRHGLGGDQGRSGNTKSSRDVDGKTKLTLPGRISIWLPAKISGRCLSISRDGLARAGTWLCRGARSSAGTSCPDPPWRATSMSQLGGGLERWATHLSQTGVFRGPDRPNIVETIGVSVTKAEQRLLALSTCQCSHSDEGRTSSGRRLLAGCPGGLEPPSSPAATKDTSMRGPGGSVLSQYHYLGFSFNSTARQTTTANSQPAYKRHKVTQRKQQLNE